MDQETAVFIVSCMSDPDAFIDVPESSMKSALKALHGIAASHGPDTRTMSMPNARLKFKCTGSHEVPPVWPCDTYITVQNALLDIIAVQVSAETK